MTNVSVSAGKASRPSYTPEQPEITQCDKCKCTIYKGVPHCPLCGAWIEHEHRDTVALWRWETWDRRRSLKVVPHTHPRYAAWMAFRCFLLDQVFLRRADADLVAHIAAVITLGVEHREDCWWFGDLLMDDELSGDLYAPEHDNKDHGMAGALLSLSRLLDDPVGSRDDILPGDHAVIVSAFQ